LKKIIVSIVLLTLISFGAYSTSSEEIANAKIADPEKSANPELFEAIHKAEDYLKVNYPKFNSGDVHVKKDHEKNVWTLKYSEDITLTYHVKTGEVHPKK
jgi:hypothetical protein